MKLVRIERELVFEKAMKSNDLLFDTVESESRVKKQVARAVTRSRRRLRNPVHDQNPAVASRQTLQS